MQGLVYFGATSNCVINYLNLCNTNSCTQLANAKPEWDKILASNTLKDDA